MPEVARRVGRYEILESLGRGAMARVYLARQVDLDRLIALKELAAFPHGDDDGPARRFLRESRVAGGLSHPNIVSVYDYFEHEGVPYIAMENMRGGTLRPWVGQATPAQVAGILESVLAGLAHAHEAGVVHRDLKPENLLLSADGRVKVADFGIARATSAAQTETRLTQTGMVIGTPAYMAPEQGMQGGEVGPYTDLYAVGIVAYELVTGAVPFVGEPISVLMGHVNEQVKPAHEADESVDPAISQWIDHMLAKRPEARPGSAAAAWEELEDIVLDRLGGRWRRDARLARGTGEAAERPLTPAPFAPAAPEPPGPPSYETYLPPAPTPAAAAPAPAPPVPRLPRLQAPPAAPVAKPKPASGATDCPKCGLPSSGEHDFCTRCQAYLRWEDDRATDTAVLTPDGPPARVEEPSVAASVTRATPASADPPAPAQEASPVTFQVPGERGEDAVGPIEVSMEPGGEAVLTAIARNDSEVVDHYELRVEGFPSEWWTIEPRRVYLVPVGAEGGSFRQEVSIRLHPPRRSAARAGPWPVRLVARSQVVGADVGSAPAVIRLAPFEQFESRARPERASGAVRAAFQVPVRNRGNEPLAVVFRGEDQEGEVHFAFDPPRLLVPVDEEAKSTLTVTAPPGRAGGAERERRLTIYADTEQQTLSGNAVFVQRPPPVPAPPPIPAAPPAPPPAAPPADAPARAPSAFRGRLTAWRVLLGLLAIVLLTLGSLQNLTSVCDGVSVTDCAKAEPIVPGHTGLCLVLAVLMLLGLRSGTFAWFAGLVGLAGTIAYLVIAPGRGLEIRAGVWVALVGAILAILAGILVGMRRTQARSP